MIKRRLAPILALFGGLLVAEPAMADLGYNPGSVTTIFDFTCFVSKHCSAQVNINSSGTEIFTSGNPGQVTGASGTFPATQSGAWSSRMQDGAGNLLTSDTRGSERPLSVQILDSSGNQITSFGGAGGTASNFGSTFPTAGTAIGLTNGTNMIGWSATSNYGTAPSAIAVPAVNAAVTNTVTVTANAGTNLNTSTLALETGGNLAQVVTDFGAPGATACSTDTASCSLNQQMQRLAQRLSTINTTLGSPFQAGANIGNTSFIATQATAGNLNAAVTPVSNAAWALQTVGSAVPTIAQFVGGSDGTNLRAILVSSTGQPHVICDSGCSSSGGTSSSFSATFPTTGTAAGAEYLSSAPSLTSGQMVALQVTSAGSLHTTVDNTNANGSATSANSSPVVIASDQGAVAVKAASGAYASGSFASGAFASGSIASGAAVSGAFVAGAIADLAHGQGTMSASVPVVIASNQSAVPVSAASGAFASGSIASGALASGAFASGSIGSGAAVSGAFVAGAIADLAHGQGTASASVPVVLASNQTAADPCMFQKKTNLPISQNGTSSVQLVALSGSTTIYVCSLSLIAAGATTVALTTGTGTACATGNAAVLGTTTASIANSISLAANGGLTLGNGGGTVASGAASSELCMVLGTSVFVSGNLTYVQQ